MDSKIVSADVAIAAIEDGATVASVGVIGWMTPDLLLETLGERYEQEQSPKNCTFYFPVGTGDAMGIKGMDHVAKEGLMKRIVSGSYINPVDPETGQRPKLMQLIKSNSIEAYSWPIGASMHWLREVARRSPGYMTEIGLGTYVDPDVTGGKFTERAQDDLIEKIDFRGKEYLFYPTWDLNVAFIRATSSDEMGNLSFEREALISSNVALAIAVKACGGTVIAQVENVVGHGERAAASVTIPGTLVDMVVVDDKQKMVTNVDFEPAYLQPTKGDVKFPILPSGPISVFARRGALEVKRNELAVLGFGASSTIQLALAEAGLFKNGGLKYYPSTTEHGSYGGVVMGGWQFSANLYPDALVDGVTQFDVINGGLCKLAVLSFAEFDSAGVINVSKFANANPGAGGFIDIAHNAERLIFTGTFTTGGLKTEFVDGKLIILQEGRFTKFKKMCEDITYKVFEGILRGQTAKIITERAVFDVHEDCLELVEIAPGIDLQTQVLDLIEFDVKISDDLKIMDAELFRPVK